MHCHGVLRRRDMLGKIRVTKEESKTFSETQILDWLVQTVKLTIMEGIGHLLSPQPKDSAPRFETAEHFSQVRAYSTGRLRNRQDAGFHSGHIHNLYWYALLHGSGSIQEQAVLVQERYLVAGVHTLRNVQSEESIRCPEYQRSGDKDFERHLSLDHSNLLQEYARPHLLHAKG